MAKFSVITVARGTPEWERHFSSKLLLWKDYEAELRLKICVPKQELGDEIKNSWTAEAEG